MLDILPNEELELLGDLDFVTTICELGNKKNHRGTYKKYFELMGIEHTSIDINGQDGALPLDLCDPIDLGTFDMVTNFGTTEHVVCQEACWRNVHRLVDEGGELVSTTPKPGFWRGHGYYYPTKIWYLAFAALNGYEIILLQNIQGGRGLLIGTRMMKVVDLPFTMPKEKFHVEKNP